MTSPSDLPRLRMPDPKPRVRSSVPKPAPLGTLMASAKRLTGQNLKNRVGHRNQSQAWQEDAWDMYDLVGEQRFLATTLAGRMSQAKFYIGKINGDDITDDPTQDETLDSLQPILEAIGGNSVGRAQLIYRLAANLFIAGEGWLVGIPRELLEDMEEDPEAAEQRLGPDLSGLEHDEYTWRMLSVTEIAMSNDKVKLSLDSDRTLECSPDELYLIRVWRPHPRKSWEADSPTRSSLAVLREIVGLTMRVSAQIDSRLAGAGLLIIPQSAERSMSNGQDGDGEFTQALMETMMAPINDRASASAVVPLVATVPDDAVGKFQYMSFADDLDSSSIDLRDEAIRRLALGQDAPPELLLGTAGMNHWGAWLVQEEVVTTHLEPPLALICDALTTQYLWPMLIEQHGMSPDQVKDYAIWYDVADLVSRPNHAEEALILHERGIIGDEAVIAATGFDQDEMVEDTSSGETPRETALRMVLDMIKVAPSLSQNPGIPLLVTQVEAAINGESQAPVLEEGNPAAEGQEEPVEEPTESDTEVPSGPVPTGPTTDGPPAP